MTALDQGSEAASEDVAFKRFLKKKKTEERVGKQS